MKTFCLFFTAVVITLVTLRVIGWSPRELGTFLASKQSGTPDIVAEAQRREARRQNTEWTAENQMKYPIDYCRAQLRRLDDDAHTLDVAAHKTLVARKRYERRQAACEARTKRIAAVLEQTKAAYRDAEANALPTVTVGTQTADPAQARKTILELDTRLTQLKSDTLYCADCVRKLALRSDAIDRGQRDIVRLREKITSMTDMLSVRSVGIAHSDLRDTLEAIGASVAAYGDTAAGFTADTLLEADTARGTSARFDEIMAR